MYSLPSYRRSRGWRRTPTGRSSFARRLQIQHLEPRCLLTSALAPVPGCEAAPAGSGQGETVAQFAWLPVPDGAASAGFTAPDLARATSGTIAEGEEAESGQAPVAEEDGYATTVGQMLKVDAPGILANDHDPDADPLHAVLVRSTRHGTLSLQANGAFSYTPNAGFNRDDSFEYRPHDGSNDGNVVTVTINIRTSEPWHNGSFPLDVNDDGSVSPIDALLGINSLNRLGSRLLPDVRPRPLTNPFYDTSGNGFFTPIDVLLVINHLNRGGAGEGEMPGTTESFAPLPVIRSVRDALDAFSEEAADAFPQQRPVTDGSAPTVLDVACMHVGADQRSLFLDPEFPADAIADVRWMALEEVLTSLVDNTWPE